jgi:branched-chain amino acid transport system permease protein
VDAGFWATQLLTGLATAATLFLVAVGLSLVFGVTRIVNFAHGSLYMIGAYVALALGARFVHGTAAMYWLCVLGAALVVALIGALLEIVLLRRIYRSPELLQLLLTFAVALVADDLLLMIFGPEDQLAPRVRGLRGGVAILGERFPIYDFYIIALAPIVFAALWLLLHRTRWGTLVRAATHDREMVAALGVNQAWLFTGAFALGAFLAGLGGAVQLQRQAINLGMGINIIAEAFVVVVIGGMGSITGALLAAVFIGVLQAVAVALFPQLTLVLTFLAMAVVLTFRPWGLLGKPDRHGRPPELAVEMPAAPLPRPLALGALGLLAVLAAAPAALGPYGLGVLIDMLLATIFAASLWLVLGPGGLVSFGHACYLGVGAYGAALAIRYAGVPLPLAVTIGVAASAAVSVVFGWLCVRVSGVYFAMLTLALAQIVWSVVFQWYGLTGGDNGIVGLRPEGAAASRTALYFIVLAVAASAIAILERLRHTSFVHALKTARDSPLRAAAIGLPAARLRWLAFAIAGTLAGLSGALFALHKGSVFPSVLAITRSIDVLVMVLLGGMQSLAGAVVGAIAFVGLQTEILRYTDYWRLVLGLLIVVLVLAFPTGIVGAVSGVLRGRARTPRANALRSGA